MTYLLLTQSETAGQVMMINISEEGLRLRPAVHFIWQSVKSFALLCCILWVLKMNNSSSGCEFCLVNLTLDKNVAPGGYLLNT